MNRVAAIAIAAVAAWFLAGPFADPVTARAAGPDSVAAALAQLDALNNQVDQANARLDAADRKLVADQVSEGIMDAEISAIARRQYQQPSLIVRFFQAGSLSQLLGDISSDQLMAAK